MDDSYPILVNLEGVSVIKETIVTLKENRDWLL